MSLSTLAAVKASSVKTAAGCCPSSQQFIDLINDATERLMDAGDWSGLLVPIRTCAKNGCVVLPSWVGEVRAVNICNSSLPVHGIFWSFIPENMYPACCGGLAGLNAYGTSPVYWDIFGDDRTVRAYHQASADAGKIVTVFGLDNDNQVLRHKDSAGDWVEGVEITLGSPFGSTSTFVRKIERLLLPDDLQKPINLYAYNAVTALLEPIGEYQPGEVNPQFQRYKLSMPPSCGTACTDCDTTPLVLLVKLAYRPVSRDTDLVLVPKLSALKDAVSAVRYREAGDIANAERFEASAIRQLNLQLWNKTGDQIPVNNATFSNVPVGFQQVF
jgi:hypothetical protein